jgi:hypothetical protein
MPDQDVGNKARGAKMNFETTRAGRQWTLIIGSTGRDRGV